MTETSSRRCYKRRMGYFLTAIGLSLMIALPGSVKAQVTPTNLWCDYFSSNSTVGDNPLPVGAVIDAFDPDGVHCGTFTVQMPGFYGFLHVYGDDPLTPEDEGAVDGDIIHFEINGQPAITSGDSVWVGGTPGAIFEIDLTVLPRVESVTIVPKDTMIALGDTILVSGIAEDAFGNGVPDVVFVWHVLQSSSLITPVDTVGASIQIVGTALGTAQLIGTADGLSDTTRITVVEGVIVGVAAANMLGPPGRPIRIGVSTDDLTGLGVTAYQGVIAFNDTILTNPGMSLEGTLSQGASLGFTVESGQIRFSVTHDSALQGSGILFYLTFIVASSATVGMMSPISFADFTFNTGLPLVAPSNGSFQVHDVLFGDISGNGSIGAFDAALVLQSVVNLDTLDYLQSIAADVSGNGDISAFDASLILQYAVGLIAEFPVQSPTKLVRMPLATEAVIADVTAGPGERVTVPVYLKHVEEVFALSLVLAYDPQVLRVIGVTRTELTAGFLLTQNLGPGEMHIALAGTKAISTDGSFIEVTFDVIGPDRTTSRLIIERFQANEGPRRTVSAWANISQQRPEAFSLRQNYPNPFNAGTAIPYTLTGDRPVHVIVKVFNLLGQEVSVLVDDYQAPGFYKAYWDGKDHFGRASASGMYLYRMQADAFIQVRKMLYLK